jgi:hypothetical protein
MTFKEFYLEMDVLGGIQRFASHFKGKSAQFQNIQKMFNTVKMDIINILKNLSNSRNTFLNKLNYDYANSLRKFYQTIEEIDQQPQQSGDINQANESLGGWAGAAAGAAMGGAAGVVPGAVAGHYGSKAVSYMLPANMQLRTHIRLEKILLNHLETMLYMLENAKDQDVRSMAHGDFGVELSHLVDNLKMWQEYYQQGGKGELYGSGYGRRFSDSYRRRQQS